jgi:hypothetical protein
MYSTRERVSTIKDVLGWQARNSDEAIVAAAVSVLKKT